MAWVRPKKKPATKKVMVDDPEARRNTLQYFSCGHQPQKRNPNRLKSSDLVILDPKKQRNPMAFADENDPLVRNMLASQRHSRHHSIHSSRGRAHDDFDVIVVEDEEDNFEQERHRPPPRAQRRVITAPPREFAHSRPTYVDIEEAHAPGYQSHHGYAQRHSQYQPESSLTRHSQPGSRWSSAITPLRL
ncbi:MAG: hypothetical protein Q9218_003096 [Villophora microphyllina]